jgi:TPR repeat protein
MDASID